MSALTDRILARTMVTDQCWLWLGSKCTSGYGEISEAGKSRLVHRVMFLEHNGEIPDGYVVDHTCHDPAVCVGGKCVHRICVNPEHLRAVTNADNLARQAPAYKTSCVRGHAYTAETTGITSGTGRRYCKTCQRERPRGTSRPDAAVIREWARENSWDISPRGRLSGALLDAYYGSQQVAS